MKLQFKKPTKTFYIRLIAILIIILVAIWMYVIGKQHNIYIDNKDYGSYKAFSWVDVTVDKQEPLGLAKRDRDVFTVVNQTHKFKVEANGVLKDGVHKQPPIVILFLIVVVAVLFIVLISTFGRRSAPTD